MQTGAQPNIALLFCRYFALPRYSLRDFALRCASAHAMQCDAVRALRCHAFPPCHYSAAPCLALLCTAPPCTALLCASAGALLNTTLLGVHCHALLPVLCCEVLAMRCNAIQCATLLFCRCSAMRCSAVQCNALLCYVPPCIALLFIQRLLAGNFPSTVSASLALLGPYPPLSNPVTKSSDREQHEELFQGQDVPVEVDSQLHTPGWEE